MQNKQMLKLWLMCLIAGVILFMTGIHNVDLCRNELKIMTFTDCIIQEKNAFGDTFTLTDCHNTGITIMLLSLILILISSFRAGELI